MVQGYSGYRNEGQPTGNSALVLNLAPNSRVESIGVDQFLVSTSSGGSSVEGDLIKISSNLPIVSVGKNYQIDLNREIKRSASVIVEYPLSEGIYAETAALSMGSDDRILEFSSVEGDLIGDVGVRNFRKYILSKEGSLPILDESFSYVPTGKDEFSAGRLIYVKQRGVRGLDKVNLGGYVDRTDESFVETKNGGSVGYGLLVRTFNVAGDNSLTDGAKRTVVVDEAMTIMDVGRIIEHSSKNVSEDDARYYDIVSPLNDPKLRERCTALLPRLRD